MKPWGALLIGLGSCLALAWMCAEFSVDAIEDDLIARTEKSLQSLKIENLHVSADGRNIVLEGEVATEGVRQTAHAKVEAVAGTFTVLNRLRVAKVRRPATTPADPLADCCEPLTPEKENPGSSEGDRAFQKGGAEVKPY
ncbi:MAG: BON domain-containing protein [Deltaproteobacteria bacterium]|nr:BON domain-containing protein [Deltaproteobacteria bacterium]MBM4297503.1 BON domain-containing protein [Deltaproteobacteria bacterium]